MQDCELWKPRRDSLREFNEEEEQRERERERENWDWENIFLIKKITKYKSLITIEIHLPIYNYNYCYNRID